VARATEKSEWMPIDREHHDLFRSPASYRRQLINATEGSGIDLDAPPFRVRVSNVPLFREIGDALHQAVRVRVPAHDGCEPFAVRLRDGERVVAEQIVECADRPQSVHLLTPEASEPVTLTFEAERAGTVLGASPFEISPQRKWTVHLVHHSHYDIGYTDTQSEVMASQLSYIDAALELATMTDDWPEAAKFRWNVEVNWPLGQWLASRPRWAREELVRRVEEGRIEVNALPFSMHTEAFSFDELARQLAFASELRSRHGIEIVSAMQTDVPGATVGLATLLTDAGVRYLSVAHNYAGRSIPHHLDGQELSRPFYWEAPDGERLLVWYTDTLFGVAYMEGMQLGFGAGYEDVAGSLPEYLAALAQLPYPYGHEGDWLAGSLAGVELTREPYPHDILHLRVQGAFADNASASIVPSEITRAWNREWAFPRLRMSLNRDFFEDAEERLDDRVAVFQGDWTDWWADGIGSAAVALGKNRQSQSDIRTAQTLHALAGHVTDEVNPVVALEVERAYEEMALFDEHTWGAANPWQRGMVGTDSGEHQWVRKAGFALTAEERVRTLLDGGLRRISSLGGRGEGADDLTTLLIFNPSSFVRTDLVKVFVPERGIDEEPYTLVDLTSGESVPFIVEPQMNASYRPRGHFVRFLARDLPAIGYARYALRRASSGDHGRQLADGADPAPTTLDNGYLMAELDLETATVRSIIDRSSGVDLVADRAPHGFNGYIHDRYTSAPGFNHLSSRIGSAGPWLLGARNTGRYGLVTAREANEVWDRVRVRYAGEGADWLETTLTLPRGMARLDIENRLHKPATMEKESVYFAFPFAGHSPEIAFEITGGVAHPDAPHVPGSARHFRAIRHWARISSDGMPAIAWATREAPLVQVGDIHLPYAPFPGSVPDSDAHPGTIYSWALNNIWDTNFPAQQGGEMTFSYAVAAAPGGETTALARTTGAGIGSPLVGIATPIGAPGRQDLPDRGGFLRVEHDDVEVSHLVPSGQGGDLRIVLVSHAHEPVETALRFSHLAVTGARAGTFLGTHEVDVPVEDESVPISIAPGEMITVTLALGG
jgi:hypothetical protein